MLELTDSHYIVKGHLSPILKLRNSFAFKKVVRIVLSISRKPLMQSAEKKSEKCLNNRMKIALEY